MDSISGVDRLTDRQTDGRTGAEAATPAAARWRQDGGAAAALGARLTGTTTCAARPAAVSPASATPRSFVNTKPRFESDFHARGSDLVPRTDQETVPRPVFYADDRCVSSA